MTDNEIEALKEKVCNMIDDYSDTQAAITIVIPTGDVLVTVAK